MNKRKWNSIKKTLPKNWAQEVSKALLAKDLVLSASQVADVKRGKVKDPVIVAKVFKEIRALSLKQKTKRSSLKNIL